LKDFFDRRNCTVLVLMHCRKSASDDVLEEVSGTMGLSGAADGIMVLTRSRGDNEARIRVSGRDGTDRDLSLLFDPDSLVWKSQGDTKGKEDSKLKQAILRVLEAAPTIAMSPSEIAELSAPEKTGEDARRWHQCIKVTAWRMAEEGLLQRRNSKYSWPLESRMPPGNDDLAL
jgi:hypothetical protein